ncbi:MAG: hypothetical protein GYB64_20180, partial [Chloroflexi bacterium]|nr:hypothetical protein [Chloroflexota bacterium]
RAVRAGDFAEWVSPDMERFYERGVRHFEVHNEPNLTAEGFGLSWNTGQEFGEWMLEVIGALRPRFPQALFGWPGLSPGPSVSGIRYDEKLFLRSAGSLVRQADWIGCHCYWRTEADLLSEHGGLGYRYYREEYPDRLLFITEFSNPAAEVGWTTKGDQYRRYYEHLRSQPGVGAAFSFVVSASANFPHEVWRREDGSLTGIAHAVRSRSF